MRFVWAEINSTSCLYVQLEQYLGDLVDTIFKFDHERTGFFELPLHSERIDTRDIEDAVFLQQKVGISFSTVLPKELCCRLSPAEMLNKSVGVIWGLASL